MSVRRRSRVRKWLIGFTIAAAIALVIPFVAPLPAFYHRAAFRWHRTQAQSIPATNGQRLMTDRDALGYTRQWHSAHAYGHREKLVELGVLRRCRFSLRGVRSREEYNQLWADLGPLCHEPLIDAYSTGYNGGPKPIVITAFMYPDEYPAWEALLGPYRGNEPE